MPRARKDADQVQDDLVGDVGTQDTKTGGPAVVDDNENRSSETIVILPAEDEPVRRGGYILTDDGWVLEDAPASDNEEE